MNERELIMLVLLFLMAAYVVYLRIPKENPRDVLEEGLARVQEQARVVDKDFEEKFTRFTEASLTYQLGTIMEQGISRVKVLNKISTPDAFNNSYHTYFRVPEEGEWEMTLCRYKPKVKRK